MYLLILLKIGALEIVLIVLAIVILFGARKIPEFMKGLGRGVKEFKDGVRGVDTEKKSEN